MSGRNKRVVPWESLRAFLDPGDALSPATIAEKLGCDGRQVRRWSRNGYLTMMKADELAVHMGHHPSEIWGTDWGVIV